MRTWTLNARTRPPAVVVHQPQLDGLRAMAVVMVFLHHAYAIPLLWAGVDLFFILSGYLITNLLLRDSSRFRLPTLLSRFYIRRARRILPAYLVALCVISKFTTFNWTQLWPYYLFFLQNVPYAFHYIGFGPLVPLWSLAVEQHFYLIWPLPVFFLSRRALVICLVAVLVGVPALRFLCTPMFTFPEAIYSLTPFRIDAMAAGALIALLSSRLDHRKGQRWSAMAILLGAVMYGFLSTNPHFRRSANAPAFNAIAYSLNILILGGVLVQTLLASPQAPMTRLLASKPLRALGRVSYSFYLLHLFVLLRVGSYVPSSLVPITGFLVTTILATLSWHFVERPILSTTFGQAPALGS